MSFFRKVWAIVQKDIRAELRSKEMFSTMIVFAILVLVVFNFSIDLIKVRPLEVAPGILWISFIFAGILGLNRSFLYEKENDCLQGLMLAPMDRGAIYLGKMTGNLIFMAVMELFTIPLLALFFNVPVLDRLGALVLVCFLGTFGFVVVGTLFSAMSASIKTREVMLPILLLPIIVPIIIGSVKMTAILMEGKPFADTLGWMKLISVFDIVFLVISFLCFEYVIEE